MREVLSKLTKIVLIVPEGNSNLQEWIINIISGKYLYEYKYKQNISETNTCVCVYETMPIKIKAQWKKG